MKFTIEPEGKKLKVTSEGKVFVSPFHNAKPYAEASKLLGIPTKLLVDSVAKYRLDGSTEFQDAEPKAPSFRVRELRDNKSTSFASFDEALVEPRADSVIEWEGTSEVAALDIDWKGSAKGPGSVDVVYHARPLPSYAWVTRSGGLRLIYKRQESVPADVLAVVGAYSLLSRLWDYTGIEILSRTRHPKGEVTTFEGVIDLDKLRGLFTNSTFDEDARDAWLVEHGMALGQRYAHDHCPIDPNYRSASPDPVWVTETGVFCHSCKGRRGRGLREWAYLLESSVPTQLSTCVKNFTHYEHARYVLRSLLDVPESLLETFYRAALVLVHGADDKRVDSVFRSRDLVRYSGYWGTVNGEARSERLVTATLAGLPCVARPDGKLNEELHERLRDTASLDAWGYFPLRVIRGARISTYHLDAKDGRPRIEVVDPKNTPRYVEGDERLTESDAWETIEQGYPGVNRGLIELLVFCRGVIEYGGTAMNPMFIFEGVSGAGKTGHPHLAAALCGDVSTNVWPDSADERMGQKFVHAMREGSYAVVNEVVKAARKHRFEPRQFLDFLLQLTPSTSVHELYRGVRSIGELPVIIITDNEFTEEIRADTQLGRRLYHVDLGSTRLRWKESTEALGVSLWGLREKDSPLRHAADSLLSIWIDRYWSTDPLPLDAVAGSLGIKHMDTMGAATQRAEAMRRLFLAWQQTKPSSVAAIRKLTKHGFKAFKVDSDGALALAWSELHDEGNPMQWTRANERSWEEILGREKPVRLLVAPLRGDRSTWVQLAFTEEREGGQWESIK